MPARHAFLEAMPDDKTSRRTIGALGNAALDEFLAGRIDRRALLRYASVIGVGAGMRAALIGARGVGATVRAGLSMGAGAGLLGPLASAPAHAASRSPRPDATIRVANLMPVGTLDPMTASDPATICLISQVCDYLIDDDPDALILRPSLATAWSHDGTGQVWTFTLRRGVRFHDGRPLRAADVAATFNRLTDPQQGSAALAAFRGVLSHGGTRVVDERTIAFHLDAPNGSFPYYVSSDNYNAAIVPEPTPASAAATSGAATLIGTGPFRLESYTPRLGASFVRHTGYWGPPALPQRVVFQFYEDQQSQILALQGGDVDLVMNFSVQGGRALMADPRYRIQSVRSSSHRQLHMRCTPGSGPFADKRVRQALALSIDRRAIVDGVFLRHAQLGNDSPFAPVFPASPHGLAQRDIDLPRARQLMAAAGYGPHSASPGFPADLTLVTEAFMELPDYAVLIQNAAAAIGIDLRLKVERQSAYYGAAVRGQSDWLDSIVGITDYGHRGVPNVFLSATLSSHGAWNAARFDNPQYDALLARYVAAVDLSAQRDLANDIGRLLLDETPVITSYFFDAMMATRADLHDARFTAITQLSLAQAWLAA